MSLFEVKPEPLDDLETAVDWISSITNEKKEVVKRRLGQEHQQIGSNVKKAVNDRGITYFVYSEKLVAFYAETDAFLYETFTWNRFSTKQNMRHWILKRLQKYFPDGASILAFGDGLGFDATSLALAGHTVTYFEVSELCRKFASQVFKKNRVNVKIYSDSSMLEGSKFDAIMCLDVLEHVPIPSQLVSNLAVYLKDNALFFSHAPFWYLNQNVCTHLEQNLKFSGDCHHIYQHAGLFPFDANLLWNPIVLIKSDLPPILSLENHFRIRFGQSLLVFSRWWNWPLMRLYERVSKNECRVLSARSAFLYR